MAASVPHRPNKYFHVTASNGTVSNSPYTPLAITTASPSALVRVFDPRCRCRLVTFAALPTPSMIERAIILLTDQRFWGHASGPSSSGKTLPCSIHCWHGHAARRSALPRERFRPLTSGPEDFHLRALPEPYVNLSIHTAPIVRPFPWHSDQWARSLGFARRNRSNQSLAPLV